MQKNLGYVIPSIVIPDETNNIGYWYLGNVPLGVRATGTMWTIGTDHYWYLDGSKTNYLAEIPVETYNQQFEEMLTNYGNSFNTWFNHMKDQLDEDAAGHLQLEIDEINETLDDKQDKTDNSLVTTDKTIVGAINENTDDILQLNNDLTTKGNAQQLVVDISVTSGIEIGRWIKNNISLEKLTKGFTFNFIPTQSPGWWSGQMFCDGGSTWWGYYINRDGSEIFKYRWAGGADTVTLINQSAPYYSQILVSSISSGYTSTVKGWLVGSVGVTSSGMGIYINGIPVAYDSQGVGQASYAAVQIPISVGDTITFTTTPTYNDLRIVGLRW